MRHYDLIGDNQVNPNKDDRRSKHFPSIISLDEKCRLGLEIIYEEPSIEEEVDSEKRVIPDEVLQELETALEQGDVETVELLAGRLRERDTGRYRRGADRILKLVAELELTELRAYINKLKRQGG